MFGLGKECSLCGGKLSGNICTECGLDNSKNDSNYETTKSHSDFERLTHTHETFNPFAGKTMTDEQRDEMKSAYAKAKSKKPIFQKKEQKVSSQYQYSKPNKINKKGSGKKTSITWMIITLVIILISAFNGLTGSDYEEEWDVDSYEAIPEEDYNYNPYEYVQYELSEVGEDYSECLTAGSYKGGVHIPEGSYDVLLQGGEGSLSIEDDYNSIYQSFRFGEGEDTVTVITDFRVYEGARIEIEEEVELLFGTSNAMPLNNMANPNTESVELSDSFIVGVDVPAGVYDVNCLEGSGIFNYTVDFGDGYTSYEGKLIGTGESSFPDYYKNVVLPDGTKVEIEGMRVALIPSEIIESTDYVGYYR